MPSKKKKKHNVSYMHGLDTGFLHLIISMCVCVCVCVCGM